MITKAFELTFYYRDGELFAHSHSPMGHWSRGVLMSAWACGDEPDATDENVIVLNGMTIAWNANDGSPAMYGVEQCHRIDDPSDIDCPTLMFAIATIATMIANKQL